MSSTVLQNFVESLIYDYYSNISRKLATLLFILFLLRNKHLVFLHLSFKVELPTNVFQNISFLVLKSTQR